MTPDVVRLRAEHDQKRSALDAMLGKLDSGMLLAASEYACAMMEAKDSFLNSLVFGIALERLQREMLDRKR